MPLVASVVCRAGRGESKRQRRLELDTASKPHSKPHKSVRFAEIGADGLRPPPARGDAALPARCESTYPPTRYVIEWPIRSAIGPPAAGSKARKLVSASRTNRPWRSSGSWRCWGCGPRRAFAIRPSASAGGVSFKSSCSSLHRAKPRATSIDVPGVRASTLPPFSSARTGTDRYGSTAEPTALASQAAWD
jgi:hypothetical protein